MSGDEIRNERNQLAAAIELATHRLNELVDICSHEETKETLYGQCMRCAYPSHVCAYCGKWIKSSDKHFDEFITKTP